MNVNNNSEIDRVLRRGSTIQVRHCRHGEAQSLKAGAVIQKWPQFAGGLTRSGRPLPFKRARLSAEARPFRNGTPIQERPRHLKGAQLLQGRQGGRGRRKTVKRKKVKKFADQGGDVIRANRRPSHTKRAHASRIGLSVQKTSSDSEGAQTFRKGLTI